MTSAINDSIPIFDSSNGVMDIGEVMQRFKHPEDDGCELGHIASSGSLADCQSMSIHLGLKPVREMFLNAARALIGDGKEDKALEMLDLGEQITHRYPLETISLGYPDNDFTVLSMIETYYALGAEDKARDLASRMKAELLVAEKFYLEFQDWGQKKWIPSGNAFKYCRILKNGIIDRAPPMAEKITICLSTGLSI